MRPGYPPRRSGLVMGFDTHMIAGSRARSTSTRPILPITPSQTSRHYAEALGFPPARSSNSVCTSGGSTG
jgi:hypothetical protein